VFDATPTNTEVAFADNEGDTLSELDTICM